MICCEGWLCLLIVVIIIVVGLGKLVVIVCLSYFLNCLIGDVLSMFLDKLFCKYLWWIFLSFIKFFLLLLVKD